MLLEKGVHDLQQELLRRDESLKALRTEISVIKFQASANIQAQQDEIEALRAELKRLTHVPANK